MCYCNEDVPLAKVLEVAHILSFYHRGSKLTLFSLYGKQFPRYRTYCVSNLATDKKSRSCKGTCILFYLKALKLSLYSFMSSGFWDTGCFHILAWNLAIGHSSRSRTYILSFYPRGVEIELIAQQPYHIWGGRLVCNTNKCGKSFKAWWHHLKVHLTSQAHTVKHS